MDKYKRVPRAKEESKIEENEIRVTTQGKPRNFISYATTQFTEKNASSVQLKAMGGAISKTVTIAEIIKRRIPGLHSTIVLESTDIIDVWEPLEEGLDRLETVRHVSSITITLSKNPLDATTPGYQAPLPADQVKEISSLPTGKKLMGRRPTGGEGSPVEGGFQERRVGGRGGRRPRGPPRDRDSGDFDSSPPENRRPLGRGRGRGGRGRGRFPPGDRPPRRDFDGDRPPRREFDGERPPRREFDGERPPRRDFEGGERPPRRDFEGGDRPPRRDFESEELGVGGNNRFSPQSRGFTRGPPRNGRGFGGPRQEGGFPMQGRGRGRGRRGGGRGGRGRGRFPRGFGFPREDELPESGNGEEGGEEGGRDADIVED